MKLRKSAQVMAGQGGKLTNGGAAWQPQRRRASSHSNSPQRNGREAVVGRCGIGSAEPCVAAIQSGPVTRCRFSASGQVSQESQICWVPAALNFRPVLVLPVSSHPKFGSRPIPFEQGKLVTQSKSKLASASSSASASEFYPLHRHQSCYFLFDLARHISGYEANLPVAIFFGWARNHAKVRSCLSACTSSDAALRIGMECCSQCRKAKGLPFALATISLSIRKNMPVLRPPVDEQFLAGIHWQSSQFVITALHPKF